MPNVAGWQPLKGTHALDVSAIAVAFGQEVGDVLWRRADASLTKVAAAAGLTERQATIAVLPKELAALQKLIPETEGQAAYTRKEGDVLAEVVRMSKDRVSYANHVYTRWAPFRAQAVKFLADPVGRFLESAPLLNVVIEAVDLFNWDPDQGPMRLEGLLAPTSAGVASGAYRNDALWHTHSGWFEYPDQFTRRLCNINIDLVADSERKLERPQLKIRTLVTHQFNNQDVEALPDEMATWAFVEDQLQTLHIRSKDLLKMAITPEAAKAISLD